MIIIFTIGLILLALYMLPTSIACARSHHNAGPIFLLNLLLGWTMLGWIASLVWACTLTVRVRG